MDSKWFEAQDGWIGKAIEALVADNVRVLAPVDDDGTVDFAPVTSAENVTTDFVNVHVPLKRVFFPCSEVLFEYKQDKSEVALGENPAAKTAEHLVLGCRPCDAASLAILDKVFQWDYDDVQFRKRRESTTVVTWACTDPAKSCFCTSVGVSPHDQRGGDVLVHLRNGEGALMCAQTEKGERFIEKLGDCVKPANGVELPAPPEMQTEFETDRVKEWLDGNFEHEFWTDVSLKCLGCGACAYMCPTCHCFDIVDESTWNQGERRRNWDCCSFSLFTLHGSGHNPRPNQSERCRQRVMHKFKYYPERFETLACVGCGRCIRNCGVGQSLVNILSDIEAKVQAQ